MRRREDYQLMQRPFPDHEAQGVLSAHAAECSQISLPPRASLSLDSYWIPGVLQGPLWLFGAGFCLYNRMLHCFSQICGLLRSLVS